jgi:hypothetical protein
VRSVHLVNKQKKSTVKKECSRIKAPGAPARATKQRREGKNKEQYRVESPLCMYVGSVRERCLLLSVLSIVVIVVRRRSCPCTSLKPLADNLSSPPIPVGPCTVRLPWQSPCAPAH